MQDSGNKWDDHFTRRARKEKWRARSVYKIEEIDRKFHLFRRGDRVFDLGCSPGSWSQYALKKVGPGGHVAGIDLTRPADFPNKNFSFIRGDIFGFELPDLVRRVGPRNAVISDMAPQTSGIRGADSGRSLELARRALDIAVALLKGNGNFVCKILEGEDLKPFRNRVGQYFRQVRPFRPAAVRKRSREVYVIGLGFIGMG